MEPITKGAIMDYTLSQLLETSATLLNVMVQAFIKTGTVKQARLQALNGLWSKVNGQTFLRFEEIGGCAELHIGHDLTLYSDGLVMARCAGQWINISDDILPDTEDIVAQWWADTMTTEDTEDDAAELEAEAILMAAAPAYEVDGVPGVFVRSRTDAQKAYSVVGGKACNCPAHRKCWHLSAAELAPAWEFAARSLYAALSPEFTPKTRAQTVASMWRQTLDQAPTIRRGKVDVVSAIRQFSADASAVITELAKD